MNKHLNHSVASDFKSDSTGLWEAAQNDYISYLSPLLLQNNLLLIHSIKKKFVVLELTSQKWKLCISSLWGDLSEAATTSSASPSHYTGQLTFPVFAR